MLYKNHFKRLISLKAQKKKEEIKRPYLRFQFVQGRQMKSPCLCQCRSPLSPSLFVLPGMLCECLYGRTDLLGRLSDHELARGHVVRMCSLQLVQFQAQVAGSLSQRTQLVKGDSILLCKNNRINLGNINCTTTTQ